MRLNTQIIFLIVPLLLLLTQSTYSQGQQLNATWGRIAPAVVTINGSLLVFGGDVRTQYGKNDTHFANGTSAVQSTITSVNLSTLKATENDVSAPTGSNTENRMLLRGQTCAADNVTAKVYCVGGKYNDNDSSHSGSRIFASGIGVLNPSQLQWESDVKTSLTGRWGHSMVTLGNTSYVFGGDMSLDSVAKNVTSDLYSIHLPDQNTTLLQSNSSSSSSPSPRAWHCASPLNGTSFIIIGGMTTKGGALSDAWVFDTISSQWMDVTNNVTGDTSGLQANSRMCVWMDGAVWMFGGFDNKGNLLADLYSFNTTTFAMTKEASSSSSNSRRLRRNLLRRQGGSSSSSAPSPRAYPVLAALPPYILLFGGETTYNSTLRDYVAADPTFHFYSATNGSWLPTTPTLPAGAALAPAIVPDQQDPELAAAGGVLPAAAGASGPSPSATPSPSPSPSPSPDQDNNISVSKVAAAIVGALLAAFLLCAWCVAIKFYRDAKRNHRGVRLGSSGNLPGAAAPYAVGAAGAGAAGSRAAGAGAPGRTGLGVGAGGREMSQTPRTGQQPTQLGSASGTQPGAAAAAGGLAGALSTGIATALTSPVPKSQPRPSTGAEATAAAAGAPSPTSTSGTTSSQPARPKAPSRSPSLGAGAAAATGAAGTSTAAGTTTSHESKKYRVLWSHNPQQSDELEVFPGDILEEKRRYADGWMMVTDKNKKLGMVPANICRLIETEGKGKEEEPK
ncbi:hypothetical protein HDV00_000270 [Rhizophlyctis rosea]|nr:hypothetical protein HDV00_000270 [Rhizophlyctis rosea]